MQDEDIGAQNVDESALTQNYEYTNKTATKANLEVYTKSGKAL